MQAVDWATRNWQRIRRLWPQVPLALFLIAGGALNVLAAVHAHVLTNLLPGGVAQAMPSLSKQVSLSALGSGAQGILGGALVLSGFGLLWRLRVAWTFAALLLLITIGVNVGRAHFGGAFVVPGVAFVLLAVFRRDFDRRTLFGTALMSFAGILAVLAYGTVGTYLLGHQFVPQITNPLTALYFSIVTLSTVGYGDYHPATALAQGYVLTLIVFGLSVFASAIFSVVGPALSRHLERLFGPSGGRIMEKNHVIIVGAGTIARNTARELVRRRIPFVQIVAQGQHPPLEDQPSVTGDVSDDEVLEKAGIARAEMLIAADDDDGENAFTALAAKDLNPTLRVLAVASTRRAIRRLKLARADIVFAPAEVGSRLLANLVQGESLPEAFNDLLNTERPA